MNLLFIICLDWLFSSTRVVLNRKQLGWNCKEKRHLRIRITILQLNYTLRCVIKYFFHSSDFPCILFQKKVSHDLITFTETHIDLASCQLVAYIVELDGSELRACIGCLFNEWCVCVFWRIGPLQCPIHEHGTMVSWALVRS